MQYKPVRIRVDTVDNRWHLLVTRACNGLAPVCRYIFKDETDAKCAMLRMYHVIDANTQFRVALFRRGNEVYIVKSDAIQVAFIEGL